MGSKFRDTFLDYICQFQAFWIVGAALLTAFLLLSLFSLAFLGDDPATAAILKLDLLILAIGFIMIGAAFYACRSEWRS